MSFLFQTNMFSTSEIQAKLSDPLPLIKHTITSSTMLKKQCPRHIYVSMVGHPKCDSANNQAFSIKMSYLNI